jgi:hypothetical protein
MVGDNGVTMAAPRREVPCLWRIAWRSQSRSCLWTDLSQKVPWTSAYDVPCRRHITRRRRSRSCFWTDPGEERRARIRWAWWRIECPQRKLQHRRTWRGLPLPLRRGRDQSASGGPARAGAPSAPRSGGRHHEELAWHGTQAGARRRSRHRRPCPWQVPRLRGLPCPTARPSASMRNAPTNEAEGTVFPALWQNQCPQRQRAYHQLSSSARLSSARTATGLTSFHRATGPTRPGAAAIPRSPSRCRRSVEPNRVETWHRWRSSGGRK